MSQKIPRKPFDNTTATLGIYHGNLGLYHGYFPTVVYKDRKGNNYTGIMECYTRIRTDICLGNTSRDNKGEQSAKLRLY